MSDDIKVFDDLSLDNPKVIRYLAKSRAKDLIKARAVFEERLEEAREKYEEAHTELERARGVLQEAKRALHGLPEQIAHLEAVAASENATFDMLIAPIEYPPSIFEGL